MTRAYQNHIRENWVFGEKWVRSARMDKDHYDGRGAGHARHQEGMGSLQAQGHLGPFHRILRRRFLILEEQKDIQED